MNLSWLRAQPRHVVVKLNDMSSGEADGIFRSVTPTQSNDCGEPCYTVAAVRIEAQSYRYQTTVKSVLKKVGRLGKGLQNLQAEIGSQIDVLAGKTDVLAGKTDVLANEHSAVRREVKMLAKAYKNDPRKPYLTSKDILDETGWSESKMRKFHAKPAFRVHMIRGTRNGRKHKKYGFGVWDAVEQRLREESEKQQRSKSRSNKGSSGKA